uniref:Uncharacterized protein n=1 Tax=Cacopsylla melanoneura TaxID=428564 RepID=A0A8D8UPL0_9HEMI
MTYPPVLPIHSTAAVSSPRTVHFAEVVSGKQEGAVSNHSTLKVCHGAVQQTVLRSIPKTCYLYFFFFFFFSPPVLLILILRGSSDWVFTSSSVPLSSPFPMNSSILTCMQTWIF